MPKTTTSPPLSKPPIHYFQQNAQQRLTSTPLPVKYYKINLFILSTNATQQVQFPHHSFTYHPPFYYTRGIKLTKSIQTTTQVQTYLPAFLLLKRYKLHQTLTYNVDLQPTIRHFSNLPCMSCHVKIFMKLLQMEHKSEKFVNIHCRINKLPRDY